MLPFGQLHPVLGLLRTMHLLSSAANQFSSPLSAVLTAPFTGSLCSLPGGPSYPAVHDVATDTEQASHQIMAPCTSMPWLHLHCRAHVFSSFSPASHHQAAGLADHRTQQRLQECDKSCGSCSYSQQWILHYKHSTCYGASPPSSGPDLLQVALSVVLLADSQM